MSIQIQYISDVHLEFCHKFKSINKFIEPIAPYLAILGDLGYPGAASWDLFFEQASKAFERVFYVAGNHEYYAKKQTWESTNNIIIQMTQKYSNVHFLHNQLYRLNDSVILLGTTLWSDISSNPNIDQAINDFSCIHQTPQMTMDKAFYSKLHTDAVNWLTTTLLQCTTTDPAKKIIVLTHHLPSFQMIATKYRFLGNRVNCAFATDLDWLMKSYPQIKYWLCGHTHVNVDVMVEKTRCLTNPCGYPGENAHKKQAVITLERDLCSNNANQNDDIVNN